jgi:hypothetical protein
MPQSATFGQFDSTGNMLIGRGSATKLNITAATVVKVGPGRITGILNNVGTGAITINDCATIGTVAAGNVIFSITVTTVGQYIPIDFPFLIGLVVSVVGGTIAIAYD